MIPIYEGDVAWNALQSVNRLEDELDTELPETVASLIELVRQGGDHELRQLAERFGDPVLDNFTLNEQQVKEAVARVPEETRQLLQSAAGNIRAFGEAVMASVQPVSLQRDGVSVGMDWRPVERVACYVPGGRYPLPSTALMTAVTAQVAGVREIVIVSPDLRDEIVYAGMLAGVRRFYGLGGAQAVAAFAYGTQSIQPVDMLVGPGNAYVTEAKRQLQGVIGIDMLAGPSEVAIIADAGANPQWVAADLLAQAEHDPNARAYLLTDSPELAKQTVDALQKMIAEKTNLPDYLRQTERWSRVFALPTLQDCVEAANRIAPEHLELLTANPETLKPALKHYGALFMGYQTSVPVGDYMAGPNHTLPTNRSARFSGGLNPLTFLRGQSWIQVTGAAQKLLDDTRNFAKLEGLTAHALSAEARLLVTPTPRYDESTICVNGYR